MEYIDEKKCLIIGKSIVITLMIILFTIIFFLFVGISRIDAASYSWSQPTLMSFHTTRGDFTSLKTCNLVNECFYSQNGDMVANFASSRYQFSRSLTDSSTYAEQNTYSLSVRFRIVTLDEINKSNTNVTMYYYPDNSNNYSLATCDGTQELTISKNTDYDYYVTYKCNEFTINRDISHMGLMIGGYPNSIYFVQMAQNLQLIGPGEATNDDIINNQNQNTQDIINNQNQNQQQTNQGLQDIEDTLTDETSPNLDAFNDMSGWLPPGPVDSVLNIPLNVLNGLLSAFQNNSCPTIDIPIPFVGGILSIPCIYSLYSNINGLNILITTFFTAITGYYVYKYLTNLYVWIDKTLKMEQDNYMSDWGGV